MYYGNQFESAMHKYSLFKCKGKWNLTNSIHLMEFNQNVFSSLYNRVSVLKLTHLIRNINYNPKCKDRSAIGHLFTDSVVSGSNPTSG